MASDNKVATASPFGRMFHKPSRPTLAVLLAVTLLGSLVGGVVVAQQVPTDDTDQTQESTYLRVVHASPDAPAVDVYVDNESTLTDVSFGAVSEYLSLDAGSYNVTITAAGDREAVVFEGNVTLDPRTVTTLAASGEVGEIATDGENVTDGENATDGENVTDGENATDGENVTEPFAPVLYEDDALRPAANDSAISVVHLSPDAPAVDVTTANGTVLADSLTFQNRSEYLTVPAGDYTVQIRADAPDQNGTVVTTVDVSLEEGTAYSAMALGYLNAMGEQRPFEVALTEDATRTIHLPSEMTNETTTTGTEMANETTTTETEM
jgi:hypothetical protein